jgi:hypothetical protein
MKIISTSKYQPLSVGLVVLRATNSRVGKFLHWNARFKATLLSSQASPQSFWYIALMMLPQAPNRDL